ncbi:hypothetical protein CABS01_06836 [Colletotrichum abscissum]|uniref:uncharacterized protein n=1 Tax=Colletotrichum abscissum TaxID=1671311 RepID=UPI0027D486A5|nr:uncharacterized protein CABS01_06836 [Colletotrichum abscissum]KAK1514857.1 hypothetical protein CABS01_06836 [Colletotrichum abscissum]KAK1717854.1 hypothetical protein BDP67DRAFT_229865 [Colletotrichum lupini]
MTGSCLAWLPPRAGWAIPLLSPRACLCALASLKRQTIFGRFRLGSITLSLLIKTVFTSVERLQSRIQASEPRDSRRNFPDARRKVLSPIRAFFVSHAHCVCHPPANPVLYSSTISLP